MNYKQNFIDTETVRTAYFRAGEGNKQKLLVLHGNVSSSVFFMPLMPLLEDRYDVVVPDLRCFGRTEAKPIDATRGYRDWSDDIFAFSKAIGWKKFFLLGWSMGGDIAMQFTIDHGDMVEKLILVAPGPPYGFGGSRDEKGRVHQPVGLGSGGGTANPLLLMVGHNDDAMLFQELFNKNMFKAPFRLTREWQKEFVKAANRMRIGSNYYPGNYKRTWKWPFMVAGDKGVLNAMSPKYGRLDAFLEMDPKPPVLWIRGDDDKIVSDNSMMELGNLGMMGLIPGWPGPILYPPQPMIKQTHYFLRKYKEKGGYYRDVVLSGGHLCILESPKHFISELDAFVTEQ